MHWYFMTSELWHVCFNISRSVLIYHPLQKFGNTSEIKLKTPVMFFTCYFIFKCSCLGNSNILYICTAPQSYFYFILFIFVFKGEATFQPSQFGTAYSSVKLWDDWWIMSWKEAFIAYSRYHPRIWLGD
jgi:hypothetical protein